MNSFNIIGRLTRDPETKQVNGKTLCTISIAYSEKYNDKEYVYYFDANSWGKQGDVIAEHFRKGQRIGLSGKIVQDTWESPEGKKMSKYKIMIERFDFIEKSGKQNQPEINVNDDDFPF